MPEENTEIAVLYDDNPDATLQNCMGKFKGFILCGIEKDGEESFFASNLELNQAVWLMEKCKFKLILEE